MLDKDRYYDATTESNLIISGVDNNLNPFNYEQYGPLDDTYNVWLKKHQNDLVDGKA